MALPGSPLNAIWHGQVFLEAHADTLTAHGFSDSLFEKLGDFTCDHNITKVVVLPDGHVITCGENAEVRRWDLPARTVKRLMGPSHNINGAVWVPDMKSLITYGYDGDAYAFDKDGNGRKLTGPTYTINGAVWVPEMKSLITYGRQGDAYAFDKDGNGRKLTGPTQNINGAVWVPEMKSLITYGDEYEVYAFDEMGVGCVVSLPEVGSGSSECVKLGKCVTLRYSNSRRLSILGQSTKDRMVVQHNAPIKHMIATPERDGLITFTGDLLDIDTMTYIDISAVPEGLLGVTPYKGKCSQSLLDLHKRFPLLATKIGFGFKVAFLIIGILQLVAFGVRGVHDKMQLPVLTQPAHFLDFMQTLGLDPDYLRAADDILYCCSVCAILFTMFVFVIQERFEINAFLKPQEKIWPLLMDAAGVFISIATGPFFLPMFNTMLWPFQLSANTDNVGIYRPLGFLMASVVAYYTFRYVRADQSLRNINANGVGIIVWTGDKETQVEERIQKRRHPLSPISPFHDKIKLIGKVLLSTVRILLTESCPISAGLLRVVIGLVLLIADSQYKPFYPVNKGIDWNAVNLGASAGICASYVASLFTVVIYQRHVESNPNAALEAWETEIIIINLSSLPVAAFAYCLYLRYQVHVKDHEKTMDINGRVDRLGLRFDAIESRINALEQDYSVPLLM